MLFLKTPKETLDRMARPSTRILKTPEVLIFIKPVTPAEDLEIYNAGAKRHLRDDSLHKN